MTAFSLKIIAVVAMLIDHMGAVVPEMFGFEPFGVNIFRVIGRLAFPLFVVLLAEGFRHTKSPGKFVMRLGIFALISEIPFDLALRTEVNFLANTNIFYTLFLGGAAIFLYKKARNSQLSTLNSQLSTLNSQLSTLIALPFMLAAFLLSTDYGATGVAFIFAMYAIPGKALRLAVMAGFCVWLHNFTVQLIFIYGPAAMPLLFTAMIPATLATVPIFALYNGNRGRSAKWFFYAFYPVHLGILAVVSAIILSACSVQVSGDSKNFDDAVANWIEALDGENGAILAENTRVAGELIEALGETFPKNSYGKTVFPDFFGGAGIDIYREGNPLLGSIRN